MNVMGKKCVECNSVHSNSARFCSECGSDKFKIGQFSYHSIYKKKVPTPRFLVIYVLLVMHLYRREPVNAGPVVMN